MDRNTLDFTLPIWWLLPAIVLAGGMAYLLYTKKGVPWNKNQNLFLGILRFSAIFLILLLFLEPLINKITNEIERPLLLVGVDNSASISTIHSQEDLTGFMSELSELQNDLAGDLDYQVELIPLSGERDSLGFDHPTTDFSRFLRNAQEQYSRRNITGIILATDGIYNRGSSPVYKSYRYPIYTLGLGDTIPQRDVAFTNVRSNRVAYSGNEFPVQLEVSGMGYAGQEVEIRIEDKGNLIESRRETIKREGNELTFFLTATSSGLKHYSISVSELDGEITFENNKHELFIEILDSKKKILISGLSPHPDMRAIRTALEVTGNYQVDLYIQGIHETPKSPTYDVQVLFDGVSPLPGKSGIWTVNGNMSGLHMSNLPFLKFNPEGPADNVTPDLNPDFSKFKLRKEVDHLRQYPPIRAPFGTYDLVGPHEVLFYQRVGSIVTDKPLIAVFDDGNTRQVVSVGQGIWQWGLQESARYERAELFTELIQKLVQFLSLNESKKQFSVTRARDVFTEGETVTFDVEIYDDIFQPIEGQPWEIEIRDEDSKTRIFEFMYGSENDQARTTPFSPGTYSFTATTEIGDKTHKEQGEFLVNASQLEQRQLTADHDLLRLLSSKSGGEFHHLDDFSSLKQSLLASKFKGIIHTQNDRQPLIELIWMLILIASLLSFEWILRKYWGAF